jgi:hypothetical protein
MLFVNKKAGDDQQEHIHELGGENERVLGAGIVLGQMETGQLASANRVNQFMLSSALAHD